MEINTQIIDITISKKIAEHIMNTRISINSIANDLHISRSHLGKVLSGKRELSESLRTKLNSYLNTDF